MERILSKAPDSQARNSAAIVPHSTHEEFLAKGRGIHLSVSLTEPVVFLQGYDRKDTSTKKCTILRGQLHLNMTKAVKLKKIWILFRGQIQMEYSEAKACRRTLFTQGITYLTHGNAALQSNEFGADFVEFSNIASAATGKARVVTATDTLLQNTQPQEAKEGKVFLLQPDDLGELTSKNRGKFNEVQPQRDFKLFPEGRYVYCFDFLVDGSLPETIKTDLSCIQYNLEASIEKSEHFHSTLTGQLSIPVIRLPTENSLELIEPITILNSWRDQLRSRAVILGKSFSLGSRVPISLQLTPMAKVFCQWIKVYMTEHVQHWTRGKGARHLQLPGKKVLLFEKRAGLESVSTYPSSEIYITSASGPGDVSQARTLHKDTTDSLGIISSDVEIKLNVQLPSCPEMKRREKWQWLNFGTEGESLTVNHWIQIVLGLSKSEDSHRSRNKPAEVTLQSSLRIRSCKASPTNIFVPAYAVRTGHPMTVVRGCECNRIGAPSSSLLGLTMKEKEAQQQDESTGGSIMPFIFPDKFSCIQRPPKAYLRHRDHVHYSQLSRSLSLTQPTLKNVELGPLRKIHLRSIGSLNIEGMFR